MGYPCSFMAIYTLSDAATPAPWSHDTWCFTGGHQTGGRLHIDDFARGILRDHLRQENLHAIQMAQEIQFRDPINILFRQLPNGTGTAQPALLTSISTCP